MIVERKQFGCVSVIFVQIGLALYVIVLLLAQSPEGIIQPQVLKVQKVAVAKQAAIASSYAKLGNGVAIQMSDTRTQVENLVVSNVVSQIEQKTASQQVLALSGAVASSQTSSNNTNYAYILLAISAFALLLIAEKRAAIARFFNTDQGLNLQILGQIPRAPSFA